MPVIVTTDVPPAIGGIQRYIERVADRLARRGHRVCVVAPGVGAPEDERLPYNVLRYRKAGRAQTLLDMDRAIAAAERHVNDGVTIASSWFPTGFVAARRRIGARGKLAIMAFGSEIARQDTQLRRFAMRSTFGRADAVISISRYTTERFRQAGFTRPVVMAGCGVDPGSGASNPGPVPTILSIGRLVRRKGFDRVIASLPVLRTRFPGLRYEIIGDGPDRTYLTQLATDLGVRDDVAFKGFVSEEDMRDAYERAWCFALPVRPERHDVEGFGLVYLEAATSRLPSIGGRGSGADDAIRDGHTGLLVDGRRTHDVTHALDVLLRDRDFAAMLGEAAYERAMRDFSWDRVAATIARSVGLA
jgi:phosphatidylinositol alpha-1,6-mannosyltransferase